MEIFRTTAVASRFCVPLINAASMPNYLAAPSLSAGMVKVIRHTGGAWNVANITALPTAITGATTYLDVELTATELTSDNLAYPIVVQFIDTTSPKNFNDQSVVIWSLPVGVNALQINGTAQTARDVGASVLLSAGTGTGQLDFTSGVVKSNLVQILATALTETAGYLAAGFKALLNVASPVFTLASVNQTGDSFARLGTPSGASIEADIAAINAKTTNLPASPAAVGSNMGSVSSVTADVGITQAGADKVWGSATRTLTAFGFTVAANLTQILGTALTETTGYLAAGFKKLFNIASPVFTLASVNQTADFGTADFNSTQKSSITSSVPTVVQNQNGMATSATQTTILNSVNAITTNTARSAPRVPGFMPRPVSSTATYEIDLLLYSLQGLSEDADSNTITVHARNSSGTSRDSGLSSTTMTRNSVGKYTVQYTVNYNDTAESVYFDFTWAVATVAMKDGAVTQVQDNESTSTMVAIKAQTDKLTFDGSNNIKSVKNATDLGTADFNATEKASITAAQTAPDNTSIAAIKAKTDQLLFDSNSNVKSDVKALNEESFGDMQLATNDNSFNNPHSDLTNIYFQYNLTGLQLNTYYVLLDQNTGLRTDIYVEDLIDAGHTIVISSAIDVSTYICSLYAVSTAVLNLKQINVENFQGNAVSMMSKNNAGLYIYSKSGDALQLHTDSSGHKDISAKEIDSIKSFVQNLPSDPASESLVIAAVNTAISDILGVQTDVTTIVNALPSSGKLSNFNPATGTVDGTTYDYIYQLIMAMVNGKFVKDLPSSGYITFYKRNDSDVLTIVNDTSTQRTRSV